jgi:hypothetical protein
MITGVYYLTYFDGPVGSMLRGLKAVPTFNLLLDQDFNPIPLSTLEARSASYKSLDHVAEDGPSGEVTVAVGCRTVEELRSGKTAKVVTWPCFIHVVFGSYKEARKWIEEEKRRQ